MRDGVRIVNAARGELVDESALAQAVRDGKVAGAALDVFSAEPYTGELLELDNVVVTPHLAASTEEAQDRAGVIVAEQVVAALEGGLVTNALNIPIVGAEDLELLGPYIPLAAKLGRLAVELAGGHPRRIALSFNGAIADHDTRLLTVAALNGAFQGRVEQAVNYVNAPVIAAERGIEVSEERSGAARDYLNLVTVAVDDVEVSGTTLGPEHRLYLAGALGFAIDMQLSPRMVFFRYDDVPGVIGRVGTMFGEAGVNIANMAVSRTKEGGKALMALAIDSEPPPELVQRIRGEGFDDARFISRLTGAAAGWSLQTVLMLLFVVLVFLPPYWPSQLSFVGVPARARRCGRLRLVGARARQVADAVPAAARDRRADREGAVPLRPASDLRRRAAVLPRRRAVVEPAGDDRRARARHALVAEGRRRGGAPGGALPRVRRLPPPRSLALGGAGIESSTSRRACGCQPVETGRRPSRTTGADAPARGARVRDGDRRGGREGRRLHARADRQGARPRLRREGRRRARSRATGAPISTRSPARRRRGEGEDRAPRGGRAGDRLRAGRRRAVPAPERRSRADRPESSQP